MHTLSQKSVRSATGLKAHTHTSRMKFVNYCTFESEIYLVTVAGLKDIFCTILILSSLFLPFLSFSPPLFCSGAFFCSTLLLNIFFFYSFISVNIIIHNAWLSLARTDRNRNVYSSGKYIYKLLSAIMISAWRECAVVGVWVRQIS